MTQSFTNVYFSQVIDAANEVVDSIDRDELARYFALKNDPEDEDVEVMHFYYNGVDYPNFFVTYLIYI